MNLRSKRDEKGRSILDLIRRNTYAYPKNADQENVPLKQGLKLHYDLISTDLAELDQENVPLKQGLKRNLGKGSIPARN